MRRYKRFISFFMALLLIIQTMTNFVRASANVTAQAAGHIVLDNATINHEQTLTDNKDGTFTLTATLHSDSVHNDMNIDSKISRNGYFTAPYSGEYLLELWGGCGANGQSTSYSDGGQGGASGYVYGTINLNAGETIYYAIGGNGEATLSTDEGGGINGNGGAHGDTGSYTVGGGGGYSAIYKFEKDEFEAKYLDADGKLISDSIDESDRISKYIMIAGGGGGGGAGNGFAIGVEATGTPDGGAGGIIGNTYGVLSGTGYDVPGIFFPGEDGKSSGTSVNYIGHGGTNLPGTISDTLLSFFEGEEPNDWKGTYNTSTLGGYGGAGNLRGGAGGAGFCGGSGGIMTSILIATNVGGGGGGSSFVAETINYDLDSETSDYLMKNNPSSTGGAINITYVGAEDISFLENLTFSGNTSKYFDILDASASNGTMVFDTDAFTLLNASVKPDANGDTKDELTISLLLAPKAGFAGGNHVPLFDEDGFSCDTVGDHGSDLLVLGENCGYVNVPLSFEVIAKSHLAEDTGVPYPVSNFYEDNYAQVRDNLAQDWRYDYISIIGAYNVADSSGTILTGTVAPTETTKYTVFFTVTPKETELAAVGSVNEVTTFSAIAVYTVLQPGEGTLNGNTVNYSKTLNFNEASGNYELNLNVKSNSSENVVATPHPIHVEYNTSQSGEHTIPYDGYYLIQAWGGNGGDGGNSLSGAGGGSGGLGGYVSGYMYLSEGAKINISQVGSNGTSGGWTVDGTGGDYTIVSVNENPIAISGGGGGGGCYYWGAGLDGDSVTETKTTLDSDYSIYKGGTGNRTSSGGTAGINYKSTLMDQENSEHALSEESKNIINGYSSSDYTNNGGGAVHITCIQLDQDLESVEQEVKNELSDYSLLAQISQYFDVVSISGVNSDSSELIIGADNSLERLIQITDINPAVTLTETEDSTGTLVKASVDFTVSIVLKPREGFLGGNDVPLLIYTNTACATGMLLAQGEGSLAIQTQDETDYANVAISYELQSSDLKTYDKTYIIGDSGIAKNDLFEWINKPVVTNDWRDEFVEFLDPTSDEALTPSVTTTYPITVGIAPKANPKKALVIPAAKEISLTKDATIYVETEILYHLTNMTTSDVPDESGRYTVAVGQDYIAVLSPASGYLMPKDIVVTVNDVEISEYTFNTANGELKIPADVITGTVAITAVGEVKTYTLHYVYETSPGGLNTKTHEEKYVAGEGITPWSYSPQDYEGYTFGWDWGDGSATPLTTMPAQDWWVIGKYVPIKYSFTVNYYYEGTTQKVFDSVEQTLPYGSNFSVESPVKDGYLADQTIVSGSIDGDVVVNVYYTPTANELNIIYIRSDSNEVVSTYRNYFDTDATYSVVTPELTGYSPDQTLVSGTMTAKGITVYVYYIPNTYKVSFDANGGNCTTVQRDVVYNNIYGYDGSSYQALPTPIKVGYVFDGWYLEEEKVTEETIVSLTKDHTLTAKWKAFEFTVTIKYTLPDKTAVADDYMVTLPYGETYSVDSPKIDGYTADQTIVSGAVPAQNTVITVTYLANKYTLTIHYVSADDGSTLQDDYTAQVAYKESYSVTSPVVDGYSSCSQPIVSGTMGYSDTEITVYYYKDDPVVSVTVEWGDLTYRYTHGEWDPETHQYSIEEITPQSEGDNTIKVSNNSDINVDVAFDYMPANGYESIDVSFTGENNKDASKISETTLSKTGSTTAFVWLEGTLPRETTGTVTSGTCTVTIKGGSK